jgi:hypothetical protein
VYAQPLIKDGGALHCVTWDFFQEETEVATAEHNNK